MTERFGSMEKMAGLRVQKNPRLVAYARRLRQP